MTDEEAPPPAPRPGPGGTGSAATSVPAGPLPVAAAAAGKVSRSGLQAADGALWWVESRPREGGRQVLVRCTRGPDGWRVPAEVTPPGTSVRSRVHEYGGGAAVVSDEGIWVVDQDTQAWHAVAGTSVDGRATLRRLGSGGGGPVGTSVRHADGRPLPGGAWLVSVQEEVSAAGTVHRLVATPTGGSAGAVVLWEGSDFVAAPRPSPDGRLLAWVAWDHPDMPWDASTVLVAPLLPGPDGDATDGGAPAVGEPVVVAGGPGVSVGQPTWCADGSLVVLDDRSGWWLPYRFGRADLDRAVAAGAPAGEGPAAVPLVALEAEFHEPDWALGQRTVVPLDGGALAARMHRDGRDHLVVLRPPAAGPDGRPWLLEEVDQPCRAITGVATPDSDYADLKFFVPPQTTNPINNFGGKPCGGTLEDAFRRSCNWVFAKLGVDMGERFVPVTEAFGFNLAPNLDVSPGAVASLGLRAGTFRQDNPSFALAGIGQGPIAATPLQMALVAAGVANRGVVMEPHLGRRVEDRQGRVVRRVAPQAWRRRGIERLNRRPAGHLAILAGIRNSGHFL